MSRSTIVRLSAEPTRTRLLMTRGPTDLCKASLPAMSAAHPRAASALLEGLSLFAGERLAVVLCVDERSPTSFAPDLLDGLGYGTSSVYYDVAVAMREDRRERARRRRLEGIGDFRDLRQLDWGWAR